MNARTMTAIYNPLTGKIRTFVSGPYSQIDCDLLEGEESLLDCPITATHIIDGEPVTVAPEPNLEATQWQLTCAIQQHLDLTAQQRNYDSIMSACTYATSTVEKFRAEGQTCVAWRDEVWSRCYEVLGEVLTGARPIPTAAELIAELPAMIWPN